MKKFIFTTVLICAAIITGFAQVGIGTATPNASSILDLTSTSKALLLPRLTSTQRDAIATPTVGMVIYNTSTDCMEFYKTAGWYNTCTGTTTGGGLPPIDGFTSSNQVAATNLIAHWTFDTDSKESVSSTAALTGGTYNVGTVSYANAGIIGNCATLTNGALVYPTIHNLDLDTALESYSVSMWVKLPTSDGSHWKSLFQLSSNAYTDLFGMVALQLLNQKSGDTMSLQIDQTQIDGTGVHVGGFGCGACFGNGLTNPIYYAADTTKWTLITSTYNGTGNNQTLTVYANGVSLGTQALTNVTKPQTFRVVPTGGTGAGAPATWANYVTIGTFNWSDFPIFSGTDGYGNTSATAASRAGYMSNGINAKIDDIRVFNQALTAQQITDLYQLGNQGR